MGGVVAAIGLIALWSLNAQEERPPGIEKSADDASFLVVSMYRVVAQPEAFNGKVIVVSGYFHIDQRAQLIYLNEEAYRHGYTPDAISLKLTRPQIEGARHLDGRWGFVEGMFSSTPLGDNVLYAGFLSHISRFKRMDEE